MPLMAGGRIRAAGLGLLAVAFVVGGLVGAAIDRVATSDAAKRGAEEEGRREYVIDKIDMSADQRETIEAILERRSQRMKEVWDESSPRLQAITDSARAEIMHVLTPEQRAEYERRLEERRQKRQAERDGGD